MKKNLNSFDRCKKYRKKILEISQSVSALHIGGAFSCVEILDVIYNEVMKKNDKFIMSKGHSAIIQYVILYYKGLISENDLKSYCKKDGKLGVHPEFDTNGIEASTGSLGHGLGIAAGMALAKPKNHYYVLCSDGELHEGSFWEYVLNIVAQNIKNLTLIVDNNDLQSSTRSTDTHPNLYPIKDKFVSFGWKVEECNGHSTKDLKKILRKNFKSTKANVIIAKTTKGYPISFMKNKPIWHYRSPNKEEYKQAVFEIENI